jgi:hypothetical protein
MASTEGDKIDSERNGRQARSSTEFQPRSIVGNLLTDSFNPIQEMLTPLWSDQFAAGTNYNGNECLFQRV